MTRKSSHSVDLLFTVSLFFVFAFCAVSVIVLGAGVYRSAAQSLEEQFSARTALSYVSEKIRRCDTPEAVSVEESGEGSILRVDTTEEGKEYSTYIYCREGWLCELFLPSERKFSPEAGQQLLELSGFSVSWASEDLLDVVCTDKSGQASRVSLCLRSAVGKEARPS